jgi:hypothetical protein
MKCRLKMKKNLLIPLIWLLIYPVVIPAPLSSYVLCIGADGHVEFEIEANGRCTDAHPPQPKHVEDAFTESIPQADHCGSCIDLPIFFSLDEQPHLIPSKNIPLNQSNSPAMIATTQTHSSAVQNSAPISGSSPLDYLPSTSLLTTPLRI